MVYLLVGIAGFLGAVLRYSVGEVLAEESTIFPLSTLIINLLGSFLLAWLTTVVFRRFPVPSSFKVAIGTGFVGSFTTFSSVSVETVRLFQDNHLILGIIYILVSLFGGLAMCRLGFRVRKEDKNL